MGESGPINLDNLPDDPAILKQIIAAQAQREQELQRRLDQVEHQLDLLRRARFGPSSERTPQDQLTLFGAQTYPAQLPPPKPEPAADGEKKGHGRSPLPKTLRRETTVHDLPEDQKECATCGRQMTKIGCDCSEQLEYTPSTLKVIRSERPKYACRSCQDTVVVAAPPPAPIEKGLPGPGLLAYVAVSKYDDHLPLYRQQEMFRRQGVEIARSTLCDWVAQGAELLRPIVAAMEKDLLLSRRMNTDDIPVPVQDDTREHTREGRLWIYRGDEGHPHDVFRYSETRRQEHPKEFLKQYEGYLQADAYAGYDKVFAEGKAVEVACWAHARRKFFEAETSDATRSAAALGFIRELYAVEEQAREWKPLQRQRLRHERSKPVLEAFRKWMDGEALSILPQSPMATAMTYARNQWEALHRYLDDGALAIDNNAAERALRTVAIGRKNWMFAGSDEGGRRAAVFYTLIESAKRVGVEPWTYLKDVFMRVWTHPANRIEELMPCRWKALFGPKNGL